MVRVRRHRNRRAILAPDADFEQPDTTVQAQMEGSSERKKIAFPEKDQLSDEEMDDDQMHNGGAVDDGDLQFQHTTTWAKPLFKVLLELYPNYFDIESKRAISTEIAASLRRIGIMKSEDEISEAIWDWTVLCTDPTDLDEEGWKNLKILRKKAADRHDNKVDWRKYLLEKMVEIADDHDMLTTANVKKELCQMLLESYRIQRTVHQVNSALCAFRKHALDGRIPVSFTTDEEVDNFIKIRDKILAKEERRYETSDWQVQLLKELAKSPDILDLSDREMKEKICSLLSENHGQTKNPDQITRILTHFRRFARDGLAPPCVKTDDQVEDFEKIAPKLLSKLKETRGDWYPFLVKELSQHPELLKKSNKATREEIARLLVDNHGVTKHSEQVSKVICLFRAHVKEGRIPPTLTTKEALDDFEKIKDKLAPVKRRKSESVTLKRPAKDDIAKAPGGRVPKKKIRSHNFVAPKDLLEFQEEAARLRLENAKLEAALKAAEEKSEKKDEDRKYTPLSQKDIDLVATTEFGGLLELQGKEIGRTDKYVVHEPVGYGTFGLVFRGLNHTGNSFALKCVAEAVVASIELDLMKEINKFRPLNRFWCLPSTSFPARYKGISFRCFPMELLYSDLYNYCIGDDHAAKVFPPGTVLSITGQTSSAVAFMNDIQYIYSDIKAENVMLEKFDLQKSGDKELIVNAFVKLIDINAMIPIDQPSDLVQAARYRAPEIILRTSLDPRIDSWSMGMLAIEMLMKTHFINLDYATDDQMLINEHIARIEHSLGARIPMEMLAASHLFNFDNLPDVTMDQLTLNDVWKTLDSSASSDILKTVIPRLLKIKPGERMTPTEVAEYLKDFIPGP